MLAANYNITLDRGADYSFVLTIRDGSLAAINVAEATFNSDVLDVKTKAVAGALELDNTITVLASGIIAFKMTAANTKLLRAGTDIYEYGIFMTFSSLKRKLLYGSFTLRS